MNLYKTKNKNNGGFTLIELLVVVAIISLLSSIVFASLGSARGKARDAAIITSLDSIMKAAQIDSIESGNYSPFYMAVWGAGQGESTCDTFYGSTSNPQSLRAACKSIVRNVGGDRSDNEVTWQSTWQPSVPLAPKYSAMAWLPGKKVFYCIGSNGATSMQDIGDADGWVSPGCAGDITANGN